MSCGSDTPTTAAEWGRHDGLLAYLRRASWTTVQVDSPMPPAGTEGVVGRWFDAKLHAIAHAMIRDGFSRSEVRDQPPLTPRPFTPHEILSALTEARPDVQASSFLAGYDCAVEQVQRMVDFPWHDLRDRGGEP